MAKELTARGLPFVILAGRPQAQLTHGLEQDVPFRFVVIAPGQLPHFRNLTLRMLRDVWRIGALIIDELSMYRAGAQVVCAVSARARFRLPCTYSTRQ